MNYIINPAWFYWMSVASGIKIVVLVVALLMLFPCIGFFISACVEAECGCDGFEDDDAKRSLKASSKWLTISIVLFVVFAFVPSKDTLIGMQVAKLATVENANWTLETIKSAVDYIVESIKSMK